MKTLTLSAITQAVFVVVVNYGRSIADAIKAGAYGCVDKNMTEEVFPPDKNEKGEKEVTFKLFNFSSTYRYDTLKARWDMSAEGYRPATFQELLAFAEAHPEVWKEYEIASISKWWTRESDGYIFYPGIQYSYPTSFVSMGGVNWWWEGCCLLGVYVPGLKERIPG